MGCRAQDSTRAEVSAAEAGGEELDIEDEDEGPTFMKWEYHFDSKAQASHVRFEVRKWLISIPPQTATSP